MPADDAIYEAVKNALLKDGWTITDDPYWMKFGRDNIVALDTEEVLQWIN